MNPSRKDLDFTDKVHIELANMCTLIYNEETMVNGIVMFMDMTGMTMKHHARDMEGMRKWSQVWEVFMYLLCHFNSMVFLCLL